MTTEAEVLHVWSATARWVRGEHRTG